MDPKPWRQHYPAGVPHEIDPSQYGSLTQLLEENGVETRDLLPMVNQPVYARYGDLRAENPVSAGLVDNGFYIGCHQYITDEDADRVVGLVRKFFA